MIALCTVFMIALCTVFMIALCKVFMRIEMYVVILNIGKAKCQRPRVRRCRKLSGRGLSSGACWDIAAESGKSRYVLCGKEAIHATVQYSRIPEKRKHHEAGIFDKCVPKLTDRTDRA